MEEDTADGAAPLMKNRPLLGGEMIVKITKRLAPAPRYSARLSPGHSEISRMSPPSHRATRRHTLQFHREVRRSKRIRIGPKSRLRSTYENTRRAPRSWYEYGFSTFRTPNKNASREGEQVFFFRGGCHQRNIACGGVEVL